MTTLAKTDWRRYAALAAMVVIPAVLLILVGHAYGQDIEQGVADATTNFKKILKGVFSVAAVVIVVGGLLVAGFKFTQRDPHALHYLVGTIAASLICGIVAGIL